MTAPSIFLEASDELCDEERTLCDISPGHIIYDDKRVVSFGLQPSPCLKKKIAFVLFFKHSLGTNLACLGEEFITFH